MKDDIGKTLKLLDEMKSRDPGMSVHFKLDADGVVLSMLWCTGKNKEDYKYFGDAISFDTTYRTNLYSLPFGLFVGINNHFQTIVFGGVLLTSETSEDFKWAFSNFVEVMSNSHPRTILTGISLLYICNVCYFSTGMHLHDCFNGSLFDIWQTSVQQWLKL